MPFATVRVKIGWEWISGGQDISELDSFTQFAEGTADNEADGVWHEEAQVLTNGNTTTLDLGALVRDVLGDPTYTLAFAVIKAIQIVVTNTAAGTLVVGNADWDPWYRPFGGAAHTVKVGPGSPLLLADLITGWAVDTCEGSSSSSSGECGTQRNLALTASSGDVTYSIAILGEVAV